MDKHYLQRRNEKNYTSYRMNERTKALIESISQFKNGPSPSNFLLDIGAADGKILVRVSEYFNFNFATGIDISKEAVIAASQLENKKIKFFFGNLLHLPFKEGVFDIILASAVLEHIKDIDSALKEAYRVLKKNGLFCVTLPNPFYDWFNSHLIKTYHLKRYSLGQIKRLFIQHSFEVLKSEYFMLCPFGKIPFEEHITNVIKWMKLNFLLFNHIIMGKKG